MLHSKRFCKCTHSHNKCCYHYKSQNIFLFQKNNIHKLSSHYKSISLRMSIIPNFDWCARRDSPSRVGKTVHWTLFCSSFSSPLSFVLFGWCARRDSPSRVGKTVHWTLFCSSFSSPLFCFFRLVCQKGLEPPTSSLGGKRSILVSY